MNPLRKEEFNFYKATWTLSTNLTAGETTERGECEKIFKKVFYTRAIMVPLSM